MSYQDPNQQYPNSGQYSGGYNPVPGGQPQPTDPYSGQPGQQGGYTPYGQPQQPNQYQQPGQGGYQQPGQGGYQQPGQGGYQQPGQPPYGAQQGMYGNQNPYGGPNLGPTSMNLDPKLGGALSYITWIAGLVFVLAEKQNRFVRFHAIQSLILWLSLTVISLAINIMAHIVPLLGLLGCLMPFLLLGAIVGAIIAGVKAYHGELYKLPVIGDYAEKYSNQGPTF
jgi:uncharacterized membrane protein